MANASSSCAHEAEKTESVVYGCSIVVSKVFWLIQRVFMKTRPFLWLNKFGANAYASTRLELCSTPQTRKFE